MRNLLVLAPILLTFGAFACSSSSGSSAESSSESSQSSGQSTSSSTGGSSGASTSGSGNGSSTSSGSGGSTTGSGGSTSSGTSSGSTTASSSSSSSVKSSCAPANVTFGVAQGAMLTAGQTYANFTGADMNGDGKADLIVAEFGTTGGVELILGNGDGTFAPGKITNEVLGTNNAMTVGDFTGSGRIDLGVQSFDNDTVDSYLDILPNLGGKLGSPISSNIGWDNDFTLFAADINGDGKLDVIYTDQGETGGDSGYALNSGGGKFGSGVSLSLTQGYAVGNLKPSSKAADIVMIDSTMGACVYLNNGHGQYPTTPVCYAAIEGTGPDTIVLGDANGDGATDIIAIATGGDGGTNINLYLNNGDGTFGSAMPGEIDGILANVQFADVNNDGFADVVAFSNYSNGSVSILTGNGDGTFASAAATYPAGSSSGSANAPMLIADFAGNGLRGIAVPNVMNNTIDVLNATCSQ